MDDRTESATSLVIIVGGTLISSLLVGCLDNREEKETPRTKQNYSCLQNSTLVPAGEPVYAIKTEEESFRVKHWKELHCYRAQDNYKNRVFLVSK